MMSQAPGPWTGEVEGYWPLSFASERYKGLLQGPDQSFYCGHYHKTRRAAQACVDKQVRRKNRESN